MNNFFEYFIIWIKTKNINKNTIYPDLNFLEKIFNNPFLQD